jgi:hypothetical protein
MRNVLRFAVIVSVVVLAVGSSTLGTAADWQKLGSKAVVFSNGSEELSIKTKNAEVSEIKFKVAGDWTRFESVKLNFADGSAQMTETEMDVKPGGMSEAIEIKGGPKALASVDVSCKAASSSLSGRATIKVVGH